mmetsp:Transcript_105987/g.306665  ORF Transcript_105987/g.306665 Transcript_105987/m.306665 type:complete len:437 (+) Transcript_105987:1440-2750(+)
MLVPRAARLGRRDVRHALRRVLHLGQVELDAVLPQEIDRDGRARHVGGRLSLRLEVPLHRARILLVALRDGAVHVAPELELHRVARRVGLVRLRDAGQVRAVDQLLLALRQRRVIKKVGRRRARPEAGLRRLREVLVVLRIAHVRRARPEAGELVAAAALRRRRVVRALTHGGQRADGAVVRVHGVERRGRGRRLLLANGRELARRGDRDRPRVAHDRRHRRHRDRRGRAVGVEVEGAGRALGRAARAQQGDSRLGHALGVVLLRIQQARAVRPAVRRALHALGLGLALGVVGGLDLGRGLLGQLLRGPLLGLLAAAGGRVPTVLHRILRAARKQLGDLGPRVAPLGLCLHKHGVLLLGPAALLERRIEVVEPPLPALLADAARDALGDLRPLGDARLDAVDDDLVLLLGPRALDEARLQHLLPTVEALHVGALVA